MAADERAKTDFSNILNSIDRKFEIIHVKWTDDKLFEIKFRTQIQRNSEDFNALCDEWVELFSDVTNTVWAKKISNTGPKIRFRKQYQCWTHGGKIVQKELLFDARRCKGTLDMKVLTDNPLTRRKNKHIRLGLNVVVKINFIHLHTVDTSKSFCCFVHLCEPLAEAPKPPIQPNDRLPELVANMVQKGLNASKISEKTLNNNFDSSSILQELQDRPVEAQLINHNLQIADIEQSQTIQIVQNIPLNSMETIKLELAPHLPQYTQVVTVSDLSEPLLMCQSLMLDTSQIFPVSHTLPFVQVRSQDLNQ